MSDEVISNSGEWLTFVIITKENWRGTDQEKVKRLPSGAKW